MRSQGHYYIFPGCLTAKEAQTDAVQLQTLQHQTWLVRNEKRMTAQFPEKAGRTVEQHVAEKSICAAKNLKAQHRQAEAGLKQPQPTHQDVPPTCEL